MSQRRHQSLPAQVSQPNGARGSRLRQGVVVPRLSAALFAAGCLVGAGSCTQDDATTRPDPRPTEPAPAQDLVAFSTQPTTQRLVILHTSDNESDILASAATAKGAEHGARGGIGRAVSVMRALRARAQGPVITVAAGDTLMPAPELRVVFDKVNAVATSNNLLGYDVSALGNHEFDFGESFLADYIPQAAFPYLSANVTLTGGPLRAVHVGNGAAPSADVVNWAAMQAGKMSTRTRLCAGGELKTEASAAGVETTTCTGTVVGVVGATTERLRLLSSISSAVDVTDTLEALKTAVQAEVDAHRAQGVSIIVLLSHLQDVQKELELIDMGLTGVDIIVAGGGDDRIANPGQRLLDGEERSPLCQTLPRSTTGPSASCYPFVRRANDGAPVLVVATDGQLKYIGELSANFDAAGVLTGYDPVKSRPWPVDETSLLELRAEVAKDAVAFETKVRNYLAPLMQPVAQSASYLDGDREHVRNRETNLGNLSSDAMLWAATNYARTEGKGVAPIPRFAFRNGGGIRASIGTIDEETSTKRGGPIRILDIQSALRFNNPLVIGTVSHEDLRQTLESALRGVGTGRGSFPHFSSEVRLTYSPLGAEQTHTVVDGSITAIECPGARVRSLEVTTPDGPLVIVKDGVTQLPKQPISFVTLAYMAKGGDGAFPAAVDRVQRVEVPSTEQESMQRFIEARVEDGTWNAGANYQVPVENRADTFHRVVKVNIPSPPVPKNCPAVVDPR